MEKERHKQEMHKVLMKFVSTDKDFKKPLMEPFPMSGWMGMDWVCATDAHLLLVVPTAKANEYEGHAKTPNVAAVMPEMELEEPISVEELEAAIAKIAVKEYPLTLECDICEGVGKFEHGRHWYDCKECDETGMIKIEGEFAREPDRDVKILLGDTMLKPLALITVVEAMKAIGGQPRIVFKQPTKVVFEFGGCYILMMGVMQSPEDIKRAVKV